MSAGIATEEVNGVLLSELGFRMEVRSTSYLDDQPQSRLRSYDVTLIGKDYGSPEASEFTIATGEAMVLQPYLLGRFGTSLWEALDDHDDHDVRAAAKLFADDDAFEHLNEVTEYNIEAGLFLQSVVVDPAWRGHRFGLRFAAEMLLQLGAGCGWALSYPHPFSGGRSEVAEVEGLRSYWAQLGFEPFQDGFDVLSFASEDTMQRLTALSLTH